MILSIDGRNERLRAKLLTPAVISILSMIMVVADLALPANAADYTCGPTTGFECTTGGYGSQDTGGWVESRFGWGAARAKPADWAAFDGHNCTRYAAFKLRQNGLVEDPIPASISWGNAAEWDDTMRTYVGIESVNEEPAEGSIAQWNGGYGHVAYVEEVGPDYIRITEDNYPLSGYGTGTSAERVIKRDSGWPDNFIHLADVPATIPAPLSMALIIDSSGSMTSSDPGSRRLDAANAYVAASLPTDEVGVVDFDGSSRVAIDAVEVDTNRQPLTDAIATIDSSGGTDLGVGLTAGFGVLDAASGVERAAIFLTDGQGTYGGQASLFRDKGWKVFTIGLGSGVDGALLQQIATETGGRYIPLSSSMNLVCEFQQIRLEVLGLPTGSCEPSGMILQGATNTFQVTVSGESLQGSSPPLQGGTVPLQGSGAIGQATFTNVWGGSEIDMTLTTPSGRTIDAQTTDPDVVVYSGPTYETFTITDPEQGDWTVDLYGADIPEGGEEYFFSTVMIPKPDGTGPVITWVDPIDDGAAFTVGRVPATPTCTATDDGSGVDADGCVVSGYSTDPGQHVLVATATDTAGNTTTEQRAYAVWFRDVQQGAQFDEEILWLATQGISTGWPDGTFRPVQPVNRDAIAAFLYRLAGSPDFTPPATSPFRDVEPTDQFYTEICWLASTGVSTGWPDGTFRPLWSIDRDAMAAFLHRFATFEDATSTAGFTAPSVSPFTDVSPDQQFYTEMTWLASTGISTGWPTRSGAEYRPWSDVNRDAMAAFMYRYDGASTP